MSGGNSWASCSVFMRITLPTLGHFAPPHAQLAPPDLRFKRRKGYIMNMTETPTTPGAAIRVLRIAAGLTIEQVAREAGVSPTHLSRVETGTKPATNAYLGVVSEAISRHLGTAA